jgi:HlyD family secretion protein
LFSGTVDESEVGKIKEGMPVSITVGALGEQRFKGTLEYIAPKGVPKDGSIQFEVRAKLELAPGTALRANYSANADIILERREHVLAVAENLVRYEGNKTFVEVETAPGRFEKRAVTLGVSDSIDVEVVSGLDATATLKVQDGVDTAPPPAPRH